MIACYVDQFEIVKLLLDKGARLDGVTDVRWTIEEVIFYFLGSINLVFYTGLHGVAMRILSIIC